VIYHNAFSQTDQVRTEHRLHFTREVLSQFIEDSNIRAQLKIDKGVEITWNANGSGGTIH
jgi:hypothetical protein